MSHHWLRSWLAANQATSHYLNQGWSFYWCMYASLTWTKWLTWCRWTLKCFFMAEDVCISSIILPKCVPVGTINIDGPKPILEPVLIKFHDSMLPSQGHNEWNNLGKFTMVMEKSTFDLTTYGMGYRYISTTHQFLHLQYFRAHHIPLPKSPGQVNLPVRQVDLSKVFFYVI